MDRTEFVCKIKAEIDDSDMILIGLGEEFECRKMLMENERYLHIYNEMKENNFEWIFPYLNFYFINKCKPEIIDGLNKLQEMVKNKNYFLVTTCCNDIAYFAGFEEEKIVTPCGGFKKMQYFDGADKCISETDKNILTKLDDYFENKITFAEMKNEISYNENPMVFNSILLENYLENGYLEQWEAYTNWIQRTLNKKLCVVELGVGMSFPSVIRWPFEKISFFNQKASFFRVHESLYQISKELHEKGLGLEENAGSFVCLLS